MLSTHRSCVHGECTSNRQVHCTSHCGSVRPGPALRAPPQTRMSQPGLRCAGGPLDGNDGHAPAVLSAGWALSCAPVQVHTPENIGLWLAGALMFTRLLPHTLASHPRAHAAAGGWAGARAGGGRRAGARAMRTTRGLQLYGRVCARAGNVRA